ncbi:hypothetical protein CC86DRAFT_409484 [Ophiobolus disseminans]|uniref:F-box domain-containing protein n=1 Tax=Ophiobolus disseminans TaxID=1469910 RepID=A0A6A6ZR49_9PLEO|nr:hypothetical protein CC86DRAFT_409484 [Ophiobolus disseminans]
MSFASLSTELDTTIVSFLDTPALNAFSKISKYYRSRIFFTLLSRKELALHILSIRVEADAFRARESGAQEERNSIDLWNYASAIQGTITTIMSLELGCEIHHERRAAWFGSIFLRDSYQKSADNILALTLCLATNIRGIDIYFRNASFAYLQVRSVPDQSWAGTEAPFAKPKALVLRGPGVKDHVTPLLPSLTSLEFRNASLQLSENKTMLTEPLPKLSDPRLQRPVLVLVDNCFPDLLELTVQKHSLCNLKEIIVDCCEFVILDRSFDLDRLIRTLGQCTPEIESLRWTNQYVRYNARLPHFNSFKALNNLRKLHVNFELLVPDGDNDLEALTNPHTIFPDSLEDLALNNMKVSQIHRLVGRLHNKIEYTENLSEKISMALTFLRSNSNLSSVWPCTWSCITIPPRKCGHSSWSPRM